MRKMDKLSKSYLIMKVVQPKKRRPAMGSQYRRDTQRRKPKVRHEARHQAYKINLVRHRSSGVDLKTICFGNVRWGP